MAWLTVIKLLLVLADKLFDYVNRNKLLNEGSLLELSEQAAHLNEKVTQVRKARLGVQHDANSGKLFDDDGFRRD